MIVALAILAFITLCGVYMIQDLTNLMRDTRTVGEWFHCHPFEACDAVESVLRHGIPTAYWVRNDPDQEGALARIAEAAARRIAA